MTYIESAKGITITQKRAAQEVRNHGLDPADFFAEAGRWEFYKATDVLEWIGY